MAGNNTILLKGDGLFKERDAGGTIRPGHLINYTNADKVVVHASADANAFPMFAVENDLEGNTIDDDYAADDRVYFVIPSRGAEVWALVPAGAAAIVVGDLLASNGDGTLKKTAAAAPAAGNVRSLVARALEAIDNSGGGSPARIKVEII